MSILKIKTPVGKKEYVCKHCGKPIPVGEKHVTINYKKDASFVTDRYHTRCYNFREKYLADKKPVVDVPAQVNQYIEAVHCSKCPNYGKFRKVCKKESTIFNCPNLKQFDKVPDGSKD